MILYLDSSALVKLYVREDRSADVMHWRDAAEAVATSVVGLRRSACRICQAGEGRTFRIEVTCKAPGDVQSGLGRLSTCRTFAFTDRQAGDLAEIYALRGLMPARSGSRNWVPVPPTSLRSTSG